MKKLLLSFAVFSIVACSNDEDSTPGIIGTWKMEKATVYLSSVKKTETYYLSGCDLKNTFEFKQNDVIITNYTSHGMECLPSGMLAKKYSYDSQTKKLVYEDDMNQSNIVSELTNANLVIENHIDVDKDGIDDIIKTHLVRVK